MRAIIWNGPGEVQLEKVDDPTIIRPDDVLVRVTKSAICGTDLHLYQHGEAFGFSPGTQLGHEFIGVIEEVGAQVQRLSIGDKVVSPFWISCGHCSFCRDELHTSCSSGHPYGGGPALWGSDGPPQGGQSEYVRVPMAETTLEAVPERLADPRNDNALLMMTDNFPTGYHAAVGAEIFPGSTVLVIGDGAVGLLAAHAATLFGPAVIVMIGHHDHRLAVGERLGVTHPVNSTTTDPAPVLDEITGGLGPHSVIDAVSNASSLRYAAETVRPGGTVSWVGMSVFFDPPQLPWDLAFFRNIRFHGGAAPVRRYLRRLWPLVEHGRIDPALVLSHDLPLDQAATGYDIMAHREGVKVALSP